MNTSTNKVIWVPAADVAVGDAVVEADGYLLAVLEVTRAGNNVTMRLANDFSPMNAWRSTGHGLSLRKRSTSKVAISRGAGSMLVGGGGAAASCDPRRS
jgi:hypothetical protein